MKVETIRHHNIELDESERWDYTARHYSRPSMPLATINVARISIRTEGLHDRPMVWFAGPRRLKRGGLSVADPIHFHVAVDQIPGAITRQLRSAGVL